MLNIICGRRLCKNGCTCTHLPYIDADRYSSEEAYRSPYILSRRKISYGSFQPTFLLARLHLEISVPIHDRSISFQSIISLPLFIAFLFIFLFFFSLYTRSLHVMNAVVRFPIERCFQLYRHCFSSLFFFKMKTLQFISRFDAFVLNFNK